MAPFTGSRAAAGGLWLLGALLVCASASTGFESGSGVIEELRAVVTHLAGKGKTYLGRLAGEQTVLSFHKAVAVVAEGLASGLNVLLQYLSHFLQAAGLQVAVLRDSRVTPEGLLFVVQWVVVALVGYWLISLVLRLVASTVRGALWLLKVASALACFSFILSDHSVGTHTMAVRLAVLLCVCALLGLGRLRGSSAADQAARLEEQVRVLERRVREMERWRKTTD